MAPLTEACVLLERALMRTRGYPMRPRGSVCGCSEQSKRYGWHMDVALPPGGTRLKAQSARAREKLESFADICRILDAGCDCGRPWKHLEQREGAAIRAACAKASGGTPVCPRCHSYWSSKHAFLGYEQRCKRCEHAVMPWRLQQCEFDFTERDWDRDPRTMSSGARGARRAVTTV